MTALVQRQREATRDGSNGVDPGADLGPAHALAMRHPGLAAGVLATAGCVLFSFALTAVSLLRVPAVLLAAPWAFSLALVAAAGLLARYARRRVGTAGIDRDMEQRILDLAVMTGGRVTTTSVAYGLSLPLSEADAALTALAKAGYISVETHPLSNVVVFVFPDIDTGFVAPRMTHENRVTVLPEIATIGATTLVPSSSSPLGLVRVSSKSRLTAALLAFCGGAVGAHKFYLQQRALGVLYLLMFWTFLPAIVGLFEGVGYLFMGKHAFDIKYNARLI
jgi:TM2 domain-containing membrane protein YozV